MSPIMQVNDIYKKIGPTNIINSVTLSLNEGEIVAVMGPSGSGKSTLLYCMAGITPVDSGTITYNDETLSQLKRDELIKLRRTDFGFIFQSGELISEIPVRENIAMPLFLRGDKKQAAYKNAENWIAYLGLKDVANALPQTLSGGEIQRVAIARAMAINPKIIFADEPTGSLDSANSQKVIQLITRIAREHNTAVVMVTHSKEVAHYADRIITIRDGQVETKPAGTLHEDTSATL